jgi:amidophosphoribosyltransferase
MRALPGNVGLGQVRYPTAGNAFSEDEAQPFYVNAPFGLVLSHNGNLTNAAVLKAELFNTDHRHINTDSDSEVLLNVLAHELEKTTRGLPLTPIDVFAAVRGVHKRIKGSYAVVALIAGHGLLAFREAASMGTWLAIHLGFVLALFLTMPYGKFVHGMYRLVALVRHHLERRRPVPGIAAE